METLISEIPSLMAHFGFPRRFLGRDFSLPKSMAKYVGCRADDLELSRGACLTGKTGVGKTMSAALLVRDWLTVRAEKSVPDAKWGSETRAAWRFIVFPEFIMRVQDSFKNERSEKTAFQMLNAIATAPYLVIDDLGAEKPTEYVRQATYYIINHREMNLLPTFITTNFSMDHLDENIDPRISSRIAGMCDVVRLEGPDLRLKKAMAVAQ